MLCFLFPGSSQILRDEFFYFSGGRSACIVTGLFKGLESIRRKIQREPDIGLAVMPDLGGIGAPARGGNLLAVIPDFLTGQVQIVIPGNSIAARIDLNLLKQAGDGEECLEGLPFFRERADVVTPIAPIRETDIEHQAGKGLYRCDFMMQHENLSFPLEMEGALFQRRQFPELLRLPHNKKRILMSQKPFLHEG